MPITEPTIQNLKEFELTESITVGETTLREWIRTKEIKKLWKEPLFKSGLESYASRICASDSDMERLQGVATLQLAANTIKPNLKKEIHSYLFKILERPL
ncbi:MAG: hypothetical protein ACE5G1_15670, partial [bacterium]